MHLIVCPRSRGGKYARTKVVNPAKKVGNNYIPGLKGSTSSPSAESTPSPGVTMNNLLESQVTDLAYLAESPIVLSTNMNDQRQSSSAGTESPANIGNGSGNKRKSDETNGNGTTHTRAKRNRYISIAWYVQDSPCLFPRD